RPGPRSGAMLAMRCPGGGSADRRVRRGGSVRRCDGRLRPSARRSEPPLGSVAAAAAGRRGKLDHRDSLSQDVKKPPSLRRGLLYVSARYELSDFENVIEGSVRPEELSGLCYGQQSFGGRLCWLERLRRGRRDCWAECRVPRGHGRFGGVLSSSGVELEDVRPLAGKAE